MKHEGRRKHVVGVDPDGVAADHLIAPRGDGVRKAVATIVFVG
jgi:hypothetical protein